MPGFVTVLVGGETGEIYMIAVDPSAHRRGIARALTGHALEQMRGAGCRLALVSTGGDAGHAPARQLYESAGFTGLPLVNYLLPDLANTPGVKIKTRAMVWRWVPRMTSTSPERLQTARNSAMCPSIPAKNRS